jgi:hypothetical protein
MLYLFIVKTSDNDTFQVLAPNTHEACMDVLCEYDDPQYVRIISVKRKYVNPVPVFVAE